MKPNRNVVFAYMHRKNWKYSKRRFRRIRGKLKEMLSKDIPETKEDWFKEAKLIFKGK